MTTLRQIQIASQVIAFLFCVIVLCGWLSDSLKLTSWGGNVTSKPTTAICLALLNMVLLSRSETKLWGKGVAAFVVFYAVASLIPDLGASTWFIEERAGAINSVAPGVLSIVAAVLICCWSVVIDFQTFINTACGLSVALALVALAGHATDKPLMTYYVPELATGMAVPTAGILLLMGVGYYEPDKTRYYFLRNRK